MSHYTNDTDTLRQMISQSIPQMFSSLITVISVFCAMLSVNVWLTLVIVICITFILNITKFVAGRSSTYFIRQQASIGDVNGYIEEMINGQKVIKVFCHEEAAENIFYEKNANLCEDATAANMFANVLMPIMKQPRTSPVCPRRYHRRCPGSERRQRSDIGCHRFFPSADQIL